MGKQDVYIQSILEVYPDFPIISVEFIGSGQNSDVLILNGEWVFRFPKYTQALNQLRVEAVILTGIQGFVPLDVPTPVWTHLEGQGVGSAFTGHRRIPGEPLWRKTLLTIKSEEILDSLAAQLSGFLRALHRVPYAKAINLVLPKYDTLSEWMDIFTRIQERLFAYMRPEARERVRGHFETYLADESHFDYTPVLKHGDFGPSNIIYEAKNERVLGVIDFGGSGIGDPAYDFAGLLSGYGKDFLKRCEATYSELESFMERVLFYQGTFALLEALFGEENGDQEAFKDGMENYI